MEYAICTFSHVKYNSLSPKKLSINFNIFISNMKMRRISVHFLRETPDDSLLLRIHWVDDKRWILPEFHSKVADANVSIYDAFFESFSNGGKGETENLTNSGIVKVSEELTHTANHNSALFPLINSREHPSILIFERLQKTHYLYWRRPFQTERRNWSRPCNRDNAEISERREAKG